MYSFGPQGGQAILYPVYREYEATTIFSPVAGANPLDNNLPHQFNRIIGQQQLFVNNTSTGFVWSISLIGGSNVLSNGYIGSFDPSANYYLTKNPFNAQVTGIPTLPLDTRINRFQVNTAAPDNKSYILSYSPYPNVNPTIELVAPSTIGNATLELKTVYIRNIPS